MKFLINILNFLLFTSIVKSQPAFNEGLITYKCDSAINRLNGRPLTIDREIRLYKKGNLYRLETIERGSNKYSEKGIEIQIINENGKYLFEESSFSLKQIAFFISFENEKQLLAQRALKGQLNTYEVEKINSYKTIFNFHVEEVTLKDENSKNYINISLSRDVKTNFGLFFELYRKLDGTPLQFYDYEGDMQLHYNAVSIKKTRLLDDLFYMKSNYKIVDLDQISR